MISSQDQRFISEAFNTAHQSPCLHRHGCVAVMNGKIVGHGYNHYNVQSNSPFNTKGYSCHAEIDTLKNVWKRYCFNRLNETKQLKVV